MMFGTTNIKFKKWVRLVANIIVQVGNWR